MSEDLVARLRAVKDCDEEPESECHGSSGPYCEQHRFNFLHIPLLREAADTIARLQRERDEAIANVAAAERRISYLCDAHERQWLRADAAAARLRALEGK